MFGIGGIIAILGKVVTFIPGVTTAVTSYLNKRSDNGVLIEGQRITGDVTLGQAQLAAYIEERKVIAAERAGQRTSLWTAWMIPFAFLISIYHYGAVMLDSVHHFDWKVYAMPEPYAGLQVNIILTVVGVTAGVAAVKKIFSK